MFALLKLTLGLECLTSQRSGGYELRHKSWSKRRNQDQLGKRKRCFRHLPCQERKYFERTLAWEDVITSHSCSPFPLSTLESQDAWEAQKQGNRKQEKLVVWAKLVGQQIDIWQVALMGDMCMCTCAHTHTHTLIKDLPGGVSQNPSGQNEVEHLPRSVGLKWNRDMTVECPTLGSAHVIISQFVIQSAPSGSEMTMRSLLGILSLSLSAPLLLILSLSLSLSLSKNKLIN